MPARRVRPRLGKLPEEHRSAGKVVTRWGRTRYSLPLRDSWEWTDPHQSQPWRGRSSLLWKWDREEAGAAAACGTHSPTVSEARAVWAGRREPGGASAGTRWLSIYSAASEASHRAMHSPSQGNCRCWGCREWEWRVSTDPMKASTRRVASKFREHDATSPGRVS